MSKQNTITVDATVKEALRNSMFKCDLQNGVTIICHLSGKLRTNYIRILPGDKVQIEMSPYDLTKGRICYRYV